MAINDSTYAVYVLRVLEKESNKDHPLTYAKIMNKVNELAKKIYQKRLQMAKMANDTKSIERCKRVIEEGLVKKESTIGDAIEFLLEQGYKIERALPGTGSGSYLNSGVFSQTESFLLGSLVARSSDLSREEKDILIRKLFSGQSEKEMINGIDRLLAIADKAPSLQRKNFIESLENAIRAEAPVRVVIKDEDYYRSILPLWLLGTALLCLDFDLNGKVVESSLDLSCILSLDEFVDDSDRNALINALEKRKQARKSNTKPDSLGKYELKTLNEAFENEPAAKLVKLDGDLMLSYSPNKIDQTDFEQAMKVLLIYENETLRVHKGAETVDHFLSMVKEYSNHREDFHAISKLSDAAAVSLGYVVVNSIYKDIAHNIRELYDFCSSCCPGCVYFAIVKHLYINSRNIDLRTRSFVGVSVSYYLETLHDWEQFASAALEKKDVGLAQRLIDVGLCKIVCRDMDGGLLLRLYALTESEWETSDITWLLRRGYQRMYRNRGQEWIAEQFANLSPSSLMSALCINDLK